MTTVYERVTYQPEGGRPRTLILRNPTERPLRRDSMILTGTEVNREGDEVAPRGYDERQHVIEVGLIRKRVTLVVDMHTGLLVEPGQITLTDNDRWASCGKAEFGPIGEDRHIVASGALTTVCGATASDPKVWRADSRKRACPACVRGYARSKRG